MRYLLNTNSIYAPGFPNADSLIIEDGLITWIGQQSAVKHLGLDFDQVIDATKYFVAPGFVDSHVHLSATGALLTGLDLRSAQTANEALTLLKDFVAKTDVDFIVGHGWEDTNWPDRDQWSIENVASIIGAKYLYLSRIDVHSALVSTPSHRGLVLKQDHHVVRKFVQDEMPASQRRAQIQAALQHAASNGVVSVHENGGPAVSGEADFLDVIELAKSVDVPEVFAYWGATDLTQVKDLDAFGAAGDLTVDGSIGSQTALLTQCYCHSESIGTEFLTAQEIADHLIACTNAGIQGGFHAIGDRALEQVIAGLKIAQESVELSALRASRHRIEHAEMLNLDHLDFLASAGVVLSMQPIFDELWGASDGLYEQRLGKTRAQNMNAFAQIASAGVTMAFSSDSPVTPIDPWRSVKAAVQHHTPEHRISARAAFNAHTRGGWRAANQENVGVIAEGAIAHLAIWDVEEYTVAIPDDRVRAWSTDERSGTPPLPDLTNASPKCVATIRAGKAIYDPENIWPDVY